MLVAATEALLMKNAVYCLDIDQKMVRCLSIKSKALLWNVDNEEFLSQDLCACKHGAVSVPV